MIRYKEKEFKDYSICPAIGDIFDVKTGEVQIVNFFRERACFKGMPVHQIMAHTFFGWKPGLVVHHKDENKLNNSLSNLMHLTKSEHARVHSKDRTSWNKGKHHSIEHKAKISVALKGKKREQFSEEWKANLSAAHKGKHHSEESRAKISEAMRRKHAENILTNLS